MQVSGTEGVLGGTKIVEFDGLGPVPLCAMILADHGADIVRIVRPDAPVVDEDVGGRILHRSRASVPLDLKSQEGRIEALRLVERADALMEGFRPGVMERLGLGPETCMARNKRLVYGRMTGWGQSGPLAPRAGHDINYIALTGALHAIGGPDGAPVPPLNLVGDYAGGAMYLSFGLLAGILGARRTGQGLTVDAAMCDAVPNLLSLFHAFQQSGRWDDRRAANLLDGGAPFYRCYECSDGRHVAVGALEPQFFSELLDGLGLDASQFKQDDRSRWQDMAAAFASRFAIRPRDEWTEIFEPRDACVSPVLSLEESRSAPHLAARSSFFEDGGIQHPAPAPRFGDGEPVSAPPWRTSTEAVLERWGL